MSRNRRQLRDGDPGRVSRYTSLQKVALPLDNQTNAETVLSNVAGTFSTKDNSLNPGAVPVQLVPTNQKHNYCVDAGSLRHMVDQGGQRAFLYQVAFVAAAPGNATLLKEGYEANKELSHRCDNPGCFNPNHLVLEDHATNMERSKCQYNGIFEVQGKFYSTCPHDPKCLFIGRPAKTEELDVAEEVFDVGM